MMATRPLKPALMGLAMGAMMLWMAHGIMTGESNLTGWALLAFVGAHVALILVAVIGGLFAARLSPKARAALDRLHRPSLRHVGIMLLAAAASGTAIHLVVHGGLV